MSQLMYIDPRGPHRLRRAICGARSLEAKISKFNDGIVIEFADGRSKVWKKDEHTSSSSFIAAAMQWARRHGATSITIDIDID